MARVGYWCLAGAGNERCKSGGHTWPEWIVEVFSDSTYADHQNITGDTCEFLGYRFRVLYCLGRVDRDHTLQCVLLEWAPEAGCDQ